MMRPGERGGQPDLLGDAMVIQEVGSPIRQIKSKGMTITLCIKPGSFKLLEQGIQGFESFYRNRGQGYNILSGYLGYRAICRLMLRNLSLK
jgi:hypothetical protein